MLVAKSKYNYCLGPVALLQLNLPSPPPPSHPEQKHLTKDPAGAVLYPSLAILSLSLAVLPLPVQPFSQHSLPFIPSVFFGSLTVFPCCRSLLFHSHCLLLYLQH